MDLSRLQLNPHKLWHHLDRVAAWKDGEYFPPVFLEFSPTDRCNQRCWFCYTEYLGHTKTDIRDEDMVRIFKDMGQAGVRAVQIQGTGEPLLNKGTPDAIVEGSKAGLSLALCSNGVLMDEDTPAKIMPHLDWIRISALASTPEAYAKTHVCPEPHWNRAIENIKRCVDVRNSTGIETVIGASFVVSVESANDVYDTTSMLKDLGVDFVLIKPAQILSHNESHEWKKDVYKEFDDLLSKSEALQSDEFLVSFRRDQFGVQENQGAFKKAFDKCHGLTFEAMVDADYGVYPCLQFWRNEEYCYGNLKENSFEEIWRSDRRKEVQDRILNDYDLDQCTCSCKQSHVNKELCKISNPPMHVNFL